jgi:hypothetical protein
MTKKEIELEMLKRLRSNMKELFMSRDIDIMGFHGYNFETEEYGTYYTGPGEPTHCDWQLASLFMLMKHSFEYYNHIPQSHDMSLIGDE